MAARRTSLLVVLALLAGLVAIAGRPPASVVDQRDAFESTTETSQLRRSVKKRSETPRREHRETHERPLAVVATAFALSGIDVVATLDSIAAPHACVDRVALIAVARGPPA